MENCLLRLRAQPFGPRSAVRLRLLIIEARHIKR